MGLTSILATRCDFTIGGPMVKSLLVATFLDDSHDSSGSGSLVSELMRS
jgi:hypothetical protein